MGTLVAPVSVAGLLFLLIVPCLVSMFCCTCLVPVSSQARCSLLNLCLVLAFTTGLLTLGVSCFSIFVGRNSALSVVAF